MRHKVLALLLILTVNCYGQGRRAPVDADRPGVPLVEPLRERIEKGDEE